MQSSARHIGWIAGSGALLITSVAWASNPFAAQMDAVVRIGTEQIELRYESALDTIAQARADSLGVLYAAEGLGVDDETLRLAEFDARTSVRDAALLAHADLRGMAMNTLVTLENFGASQDQVSRVLALWDAKADALDDAIELALDDVEDATPVSTKAVANGLVPVNTASTDLAGEAIHVFDSLAIEMETQLRSGTDDSVRFLRFEKTRSHTTKAMRSMTGDAQRAVVQSSKTMLKTLKEQYKAYRSAMKSTGADRADMQALKVAYKDAMVSVRNAMDDAKADLRAAR